MKSLSNWSFTGFIIENMRFADELQTLQIELVRPRSLQNERKPAESWNGLVGHTALRRRNGPIVFITGRNLRLFVANVARFLQEMPLFAQIICVLNSFVNNG